MKREAEGASGGGDRRAVPHAPFGVRAPGRLRVIGWILALLAVGALATAPVRGWIGDRLGLGAPDAPLFERPLTPAADPGQLRFEVEGAALDVSAQTAQLGGTLSVRFGPDGDATIAVTGGGTEHLTAGEGILRIANAPEAETSYALTVPAHVRRVTVRVGARAPVVVEREARPGGATVDLASGRAVD